MQDFDGKVAVVTGAGSGIGRGMAERFAMEGMKVVLADVEERALDAAVLELKQREFDVLGVLTDVSRPEAVDALAEKAFGAYGKVHVVCNNAGVSGGGLGALWEQSMQSWQWVFGVNFWGVVHGVRAFLPRMIAQDEPGHIVNTASIMGLTPGGGIYGATKHAVVSVSESLHTQLKQAEAKVNVSVLCPAHVTTRITSSIRNRPEELSDGSAAADRGGAEAARRDVGRARPGQHTDAASSGREGPQRDQGRAVLHPASRQRPGCKAALRGHPQPPRPGANQPADLIAGRCSPGIQPQA